MEAKIIGVEWFTGMFGTIGIVVVDNGFEHKFYIGNGTGMNEKADQNLIAAHGSPLNAEVLTAFLLRHLQIQRPDVVPDGKHPDAKDGALAVMRDELMACRAALVEAKDAVALWHGPVALEIYMKESPEIKRLDERIEAIDNMMG